MQGRDRGEMAVLELRKELRNCQAESFCEKFDVHKRWIPFPSLHIRQVASIKAEPFGKLDLSPAAFVTQLTQSSPEPNPNVFGHDLES